MPATARRRRQTPTAKALRRIRQARTLSTATYQHVRPYTLLEVLVLVCVRRRTGWWRLGGGLVMIEVVPVLIHVVSGETCLSHLGQWCKMVCWFRAQAPLVRCVPWFDRRVSEGTTPPLGPVGLFSIVWVCRAALLRRRSSAWACGVWTRNSK